MPLSVVILAAGQGTRMKSSLPKVLHKLAGIPLVEHVYDCARQLNAESIHIVYGHGGEQLQDVCSSFQVDWVQQAEQLGTAHAVHHAVPNIPDDHLVLILYGDVPLIRKETLESLIENTNGNDISLLTVVLDDPHGYGRIVKRDGVVEMIIEHKDASEEHLDITEVNTGILCINAGYLKQKLSQVDNDNAQGEYYLTDIIAFAVDDGNVVRTIQPENTYEVEGVNDRVQLAKLERVMQRERAQELMRNGASLADPERTDIRGTLKVEEDVIIDVNCIFQGEVVLGSGVSIGPGCVISDSVIGDNSVIKAYSVIEDAEIGKEVQVGPFARIRPGTQLKDRSHVGNFVEVKNSELGVGSKANHLTYIGDSEIGDNVNIGAGTITCNYDGANKHKTIIEDDVFVGSDTQLVAPVTIKKGATIGAGSTITKDVEGGELALSRSDQKSIKNWKRPKK